MSRIPSSERPPVTPWSHVRAIVLLPLMNTVIIPLTIVTATHGFEWSWLPPTKVVDFIALLGSLLLLAAGISLVAKSISLFVRVGAGTLAPWDPTRALVTEGVYRHCRNPMKTGLFLVLLAEAALLRSMPLLYWFICFSLVNVVYIRAYEEPGLLERFGDSYREYCAHVPRWLPRVRPWQPPHAAGERS